MQMQKCMSAASNIFDIVAQTPTIQDAPGAVEITECKGAISFRDVSFSYGHDKAAVEHIPWRSRRASSMRSSSACGRARARCSRSSSASTIRRAAWCCSTARYSRVTQRSFASTWASSRRRPSYSTTRFTRTSAWPPRRDEGGDRGSREARLAHDFYSRPTGWLQDGRRRQGLPALRRTATASRDRARPPQKRACSST